MSLICDITGRGILFGHNVSHAKNRTKTTWKPNLHQKQIHSHALGFVSLKVSNRGMRTIFKHGGLDSYLLNTLDRKLSSTLKTIKRQLIYINSLSS